MHSGSFSGPLSSSPIVTICQFVHLEVAFDKVCICHICIDYCYIARFDRFGAILADIFRKYFSYAQNIHI